MNATAYTPERRPLAARTWSLSHALAARLAALGVPPNAISVSGFGASLGAGAALFASGSSGHPAPWLLAACGLIVLRGACNMLDGMVALATGRASRRGELYNEVPDRLSDAATMIGAGYALGGLPELGWLAAIAAVFTAYCRVQGVALRVPADFRGPMAKVHRMLCVVAAALVTAAAPATRIPGIGIGPLALALAVIVAGCAITSIRRLRRAASLLREGTP